MAQAAGTRHSPWAALQRHLKQLQITTPNQQQMTVGALCQGVAARDPAWVAVMVQVVSSAPRPIQQQLAAQPGLLKDLAGYLAHTHLNNSADDTAGAEPYEPNSTCSCSCCQEDQNSSSFESDTSPSRSSSSGGYQRGGSSRRQRIELAAKALEDLLQCCGTCAPAPPYRDLAPALHAVLQQHLVCLPALAQAIFHHHCGHMFTDKQLLGHVLDAAEQGHKPAAAVLAALVPKVLQALAHTHPIRQNIHEHVTVLLAGGTAAGAAFLAAALLEGGTLFKATSMAEAACTGLLAAGSAAAAVDASSSRWYPRHGEQAPCLVPPPPAHAVLLQYLHGLVNMVLHLASHLDVPLSSSLPELTGPLVQALAEALSLLLQSLRLPGWGRGRREPGYDHMAGQRPYHDAACIALLALCQCPHAADLVAALFRHQPGLLEGLAASWDWLVRLDGWAKELSEEPWDNAVRLATCLLLSNSIPGQEERRQHTQLVEAAVHLCSWVARRFWQGREDLLLELIRLPQGPAAVVRNPRLLRGLFVRRLLGPEHESEGCELLLAAPGFITEVVEGVHAGDVACLAVVEWVLDGGSTGQLQLLLDMPGLGDALTQCCSADEYCAAVDWFLGDALHDEQLQEYLGQHPPLLHALVERLRWSEGRAKHFWKCLLGDDVGDGWLLQQPMLLDSVVAALVLGGSSSSSDMYEVMRRLLWSGPSLVFESLLRQPGVLKELLRVLVRCYWRPQPGTSSDDAATHLLLLQELAGSELAPRAMAMLPGLLAEGDAELSAGVFEAMNVMQVRMEGAASHPDSEGFDWGEELAASSSRAAPVLCAEEQLQTLRQGVEEVHTATAAAAATTRQLEKQHRAAVAAAEVRAVAGAHMLRRSGQGSRRLNTHGSQGVQQQGQQDAAPQQVGASSQHKGRSRRATGQQAVAGTGNQPGAGGQLEPGKVVAAPVAAGVAHGHRGSGAGAPPAPKRTRC